MIKYRNNFFAYHYNLTHVPRKLKAISMDIKKPQVLSDILNAYHSPHMELLILLKPMMAPPNGTSIIQNNKPTIEHRTSMEYPAFRSLASLLPLLNVQSQRSIHQPDISLSQDTRLSWRNRDEIDEK